MPLNIGTVTNNNISFGPGVLFMGQTGDTPTTEIGAIGEEGATLEIQSESREITQGNPKLVIYRFVQAQGYRFSTSGIEWNFDNFARMLGSGNTTSGGGQDTLSWGGEPLITSVALHLRHRMAVPGQTMNVYMWHADGEGPFSVPFSDDEHKFEYSWLGRRVTTNWASAALGTDEQLLKFVRQTT